MDLNKLMRQAQQMQEEMKKKQDEVENTLFNASVAGGALKVSVYGNHIVEKVEFDKDVLNPEDKEMIEDMVKAAFTEVNKKIDEATAKIASSMQSQFGGF